MHERASLSIWPVLSALAGAARRLLRLQLSGLLMLFQGIYRSVVQAAPWAALLLSVLWFVRRSPLVGLLDTKRLLSEKPPPCLLVASGPLWIRSFTAYFPLVVFAGTDLMGNEFWGPPSP